MAAVVPVRTFRPGLRDSVEPKLVYVREVLADEADQADARAQLLSDYLLRGRDGLDSATLARMAAELELPTEAVETAAA
jgi:hypothetical protein